MSTMNTGPHVALLVSDIEGYTCSSTASTKYEVNEFSLSSQAEHHRFEDNKAIRHEEVFNFYLISLSAHE